MPSLRSVIKTNNALLETKGITKDFINKYGIVRRITKRVRALDSVDISVPRGEIKGLIGESGSGKTTLGLAVLKLLDVDGGSIIFDDAEINKLKGRELMNYREKTQMIFQDPYGSLNPVVSIYKSIMTPLKIFHKEMRTDEIIDKVAHTMELVGLTPPEQYLNKFPNQLSGGQRQRVGIARAIINEPTFIVADEPVSMLDVSLRADILNILLDLRTKLKTSILFISHDITVTQYVSDKIAVMHLGQIVEEGFSEDIVNKPLHPYTKSLIESIPIPDLNKKWGKEEPKIVSAEYSNEGKNECSFANKCPFVMEICRKKRPVMIDTGNNHRVACYLYG